LEDIGSRTGKSFCGFKKKGERKNIDSGPLGTATRGIHPWGYGTFFGSPPHTRLKGSKGNHVDRLGFKGSTNGLGRGRGGRKGGLGEKSYRRAVSLGQHKEGRFREEGIQEWPGEQQHGRRLAQEGNPPWADGRRGGLGKKGYRGAACEVNVLISRN